MDHLAILKKSWNLDKKILSGVKTVESRWYKQRRAPYNKIRPGETIYFKNSGQPATIKATVSKVLQFSDLTPSKVKKILNTHHKHLGIPKDKLTAFYKRFKDKRYCILIFLKDPKPIKPFDIDKSGFGLMAAWLTVSSISSIKR